MSLIQDALKRQQEESESSRVPLKAAAAPSVPANRPLPDAMPVPPRLELANQPLPANRPLPAKPVQPGKSWKWIAGIIIFCVLIAWGGGRLVVLIHGRAALGKSAIQAPPPVAQPPATAISKPVVTLASARVSASKPLISPAAAAAPAFADEGEDAEDVALPSVKEQVEESVTVPGPTTWPRLKLSAVFSNVGSGQSGARLNNRLILLGDQIDGVTLIEIRRDSVVLKCGQETRSLKMGAMLN